MSILPEQCRAARALLNWSQKELASRAQVARKTVADFEQGAVTPYPRTLRDIVEALEAAGIVFLPLRKMPPGLACASPGKPPILRAARIEAALIQEGDCHSFGSAVIFFWQMTLA